MSERVPKDSPDGLAAIHALNELAGFDVREVLTDDTWLVLRTPDGPKVVVNEPGLRALALLSPHPPGVAERMVQDLKEARAEWRRKR